VVSSFVVYDVAVVHVVVVVVVVVLNYCYVEEADYFLHYLDDSRYCYVYSSSSRNSKEG